MSIQTALTVAFTVVTSVASAATVDSKFESYTEAYHRAELDSRPMLVILNPGNAEGLNVSEMSIHAELAGYVVAEVDTTTEHGQQVHELFKSPSLPHVVVIDNKQKKQIFKTSDSLTEGELAKVLDRYRNGRPTTVTAAKPIVTESPISTQPMTIRSFQSYAPPANCPSCRRNQNYRF